MSHDYYEDRRWCERCWDYVPYISSPYRSYCTTCGDEVKLFSGEERARFRASLRSSGRAPRRLSGMELVRPESE